MCLPSMPTLFCSGHEPLNCSGRLLDVCLVARAFCVNSRFRERPVPPGNGQLDWKLAKLVFYIYLPISTLLKAIALPVAKSTLATPLSHSCGGQRVED